MTAEPTTLVIECRHMPAQVGTFEPFKTEPNLLGLSFLEKQQLHCFLNIPNKKI